MRQPIRLIIYWKFDFFTSPPPPFLQFHLRSLPPPSLSLCLSILSNIILRFFFPHNPRLLLYIRFNFVIVNPFNIRRFSLLILLLLLLLHSPSSLHFSFSCTVYFIAFFRLRFKIHIKTLIYSNNAILKLII